MFVSRIAVFVAVFVPALAMLSGDGQAQEKKTPEVEPGRPSLVAVMPPGAQIGQSTEVVLSGGDIVNADSLVFSDPRITAEKLGAVMMEQPKDKFKDKMKAPLPTGEVKFRVKVPQGVPPGMIDVRVVTPVGVSNPRTIVVGEEQELVEKEPNNDVDQAQRITMNTAVSGVVAAGTDVDYTVFAGKQGQHVVISCLTTSIDSRLQVDLQVYDVDGRSVGASRNYKADDAMVSATLPRDGDYLIRVSQFTYTAGGPDHFYRLALSSAPWIDAVYPPVVAPGQTASVTVYGRNLPGGKADAKFAIDGQTLEKLTVNLTAPKTADHLDLAGFVTPAASSLDGFLYAIKGTDGTSNAVPVGYARAPVALDNGTNDSLDAAQLVALPAEIVGRIDQKRDRDYYKFAAKKGEVISIEAFADRLGSPVDLYFALYDDKGKMIKESDDNAELMHPVQFFTRTEDPERQRIEVKEDGEYRLMVSTRESSVQAGARDIYRIYVGPERPDFRLVVMPSAPYYPEGSVVPRGGNQALTVFAWRMDGFNGPIDLAVEGLPKGVTCEPQSLGARSKSTAIVLKAASDAPAWVGNLRVVGKAKLDGKEVTREARPATITWGMSQNQQDQAPNSPMISRLDRSLALAVRDPAPFRLSVKADKGAELVGSPGEKLTFTVVVEKASPNFKGPLAVSVMGLPPGATLQGGGNNKSVITVTPSGDKTETKVTIDLKKDTPAGKFALVARGQVATAKGQNNDNNKRPISVPASAASEPLRLVILPTEVAKLKLVPADAKAKAGETVTFTVEVERLNDFEGPIQLEVVFPDGTKYVTADPSEVLAGKNAGVLKLKVADNAKATALPKVVVKGSAKVGGPKDIVSEGRLSLTITK